MPGLIDTTTGLRFGTGLFFEKGLGGGGLDNKTGFPPGAVVFQGAGSLRASARQIAVGFANFAGQGNVSVNANLELNMVATFAGAGSMNLRSTTQQIAASFGGEGFFFEEIPGTIPSLDFSNPDNSQYIGMFP